MKSAAAESAQKPIFFVVDDDISVRESLEMLIRSVGWRPQSFSSAPAFLASPRLPVPSCLLLDMAMPGSKKTVANLLSEMSAEFAEFDVFFRNAKSSPGKTSTFAMQGAVEALVRRPGENLLGILTKLQCVCGCDTVDAYTQKEIGRAHV